MVSSLVRRIELGVGGECRITLTSAGSVGYEWRIVVDGDAVEARIVSEKPPDLPPGGSVPLFLAVRGLKRGAATVHLRLIRDPAALPRETLEIAATVD